MLSKRLKSFNGSCLRVYEDIYSSRRAHDGVRGCFNDKRMCRAYLQSSPWALCVTMARVNTSSRDKLNHEIYV